MGHSLNSDSDTSSSGSDVTSEHEINLRSNGKQHCGFHNEKERAECLSSDDSDYDDIASTGDEHNDGSDSLDDNSGSF